MDVNVLRGLVVFAGILLVLLSACKKDSGNGVDPFGPGPPSTDRPPNAPTQLKAVAVSTSQIDLSWVDTTLSARGYIIEQYDDSSRTWVAVDSVLWYYRLYHARNLRCHTTYMYHVRAYNPVGISIFSNFARATTFVSTMEPVSTGSSYDFYGVTFLTPSVGYIVGAHGTILRTVDAGTTWDTLASGEYLNLKSVSFASGTFGKVCGAGGTVLTTTDGGQTWKHDSTGVRQDLRSIAAVDSSTWIVVGQGGVLLRTVDAGNTWDKFSTGTTDALNCVDFPSGSFGVVVGSSSSILMTHNGGASWGIEHDRYPNTLNGVNFIDSLHGMLVGGPSIIVQTGNGGVSWNATSVTGTSLNSIAMFDTSIGIACGTSGMLFMTLDGGTVWQTQQMQPPVVTLYGVCSLGAGTFFAVGQGGTAIKISVCNE